MKLQDASKKEVKRIAAYTAVCGALLLGVMLALSFVGIGTFDYRVLVGVVGGCIVAVINFTMMCLTIQRAVNIGDQKTMKSFIQGSYNGRLLLQAAWIVAAFMVPYVNVIAAAVPLLFPNLVIFYLQSRGRLVTPSERKNPPKDDEAGEEEEDRLESFEA